MIPIRSTQRRLFMHAAHQSVGVFGSRPAYDAGWSVEDRYEDDIERRSLDDDPQSECEFGQPNPDG